MTAFVLSLHGRAAVTQVAWPLEHRLFSLRPIKERPADLVWTLFSWSCNCSFASLYVSLWTSVQWECPPCYGHLGNSLTNGAAKDVLVRAFC